MDTIFSADETNTSSDRDLVVETESVVKNIDESLNDAESEPKYTFHTNDTVDTSSEDIFEDAELASFLEDFTSADDIQSSYEIAISSEPGEQNDESQLIPQISESTECPVVAENENPPQAIRSIDSLIQRQRA